MSAMTAFGYAPASAGAADSAGDEPGRSLRERLVPPMPPPSVWGWLGPVLVTLFGGFLRFYRLGVPHAVVFDEIYYVPDSYSILRHGVEINHVASSARLQALLLHGNPHIFISGGEYVAHPPLGKVAMAGGEWLFGLNPFGWRVAVALAGTLAILMTARIARRMTRSTLLGCVAGLLMSLDGLELVLSRTGILDMFVTFWVLAAFGMLVLDRDASRARLAALAEAAPAGDFDGGGPALGIRWRRVAAGVLLGIACASKWNGIWYIFAFAGLAVAWDLGARRAAGYTDRLGGWLRRDAKWLPVWFAIVPGITYLVSWAGWFASSQGYDRNWAAQHGNHIPIWSALDSLYQYNKSMLSFGLGLSSKQGYVSEPWTWLYLGRPVSFFYATPKSCGAPSCSQEVLAIGTPAIWWASILALAFCLYWWFTRRDWRAGAALVGVAAGWLPWFWFAWHDNRTEYYYYAIIFLPYLVIAITLCLGLILGPADARPGRRTIGAITVGVYLLLVLANFAFMYPVLTAEVIPYTAWHQRMWFSSWI